MDKHTPGPWTWILNRREKRVILVARKKYDIVMAFRRWGMDSASPEFRRETTGCSVMERALLFAKAFAGKERYADIESDIDHPDARLIAAAPDLLEALEALLNVQGEMSDIDLLDDWETAMSMAYQAIKKARGE